MVLKKYTHTRQAKLFSTLRKDTETNALALMLIPKLNVPALSACVNTESSSKGKKCHSYSKSEIFLYILRRVLYSLYTLSKVAKTV